MKISGTDFHESRHIPCGGIETDHLIETSEQLLETLKNGKYDLIRALDELM